MVKVECTGCNAPYEIDERRIPPAGLKMRCPKCGTSVLVNRPGGAAQAAPPPQAPPAPPPQAPPPAPMAAPRPQAPVAQDGFGFGSVDPFGESHDEPGGIDLPSAMPQRPEAFGAPPVPPPPRGRTGGFGEIDLAVDFGAPSESSAAPVVDLPAARQGQSGFGAQEFGGGQDFGAIDLPANRAQQPSPFGAIDLPSVPHARPAPPPRPPAPPQAGLPAPFGGAAGLPAVPQAHVGLPSPHVSGSGLPSVAHQSGLPAVSAGLPSPGMSGPGLPSPVGAGLPMPGGAGLPMPGGAGLPMPGGPGLPMPGGPGLPMPGGAGLPMHGGPGLPAAGGAGLPSNAGAGFPVHSAAGFPANSVAGFPTAATAGFPTVSTAGLPSTQHAGLPMMSESGLPLAVGDADLPSAFGTKASVPPKASGFSTLPGRLKKIGLPTLAPEQKSSAVKATIVTFVGIALVGASLSFVPSIGPFGLYAIEDSLSGSKYDEKLGKLRKEAAIVLDEDSAPAQQTALQKAKDAQMGAPRHADTAGYYAYLFYLKSLRFGRDQGAEASAQNLLKPIEEEVVSDPVLLARGAALAVAGKMPDARAMIGKALSHKADDIDGIVLLGEIELFSRTYDKAAEAFGRAVSLHKSARTLFGLARSQLALGKVGEAEASAKSVLEMQPTHTGAIVLLGTIASLAANGMLGAETLASLEKISGDPAVRAKASENDLVQTYVLIGRHHLSGSHMTQAEEAFGAGLKINPQAVDGLLGQGELYFRSGRFSEAEARFQAGIAADAANLDAKIGLAKTLMSLERGKEAKDVLKTVITANPKEPRGLYWLGRVEQMLGNRKDAEAAYQQSILAAGQTEAGVPAYVSLSHMLASNERPEEAQKKLAEATEKYPNSAELARARGDIALQTGRYEEAREQFEVALKRNNDLGAKFALGITLRRMRSFAEANAVFDEIEKADKDYPGLAIERGLYFEETGQREEALKMYSEALKKAPNDIDLKLRIGSTQVVAGLAKQAEPVLKEVMKERPNSAEANHFLGRALLTLNANIAEAQRYLQRAVDLDPNRPEYYLYVGWAANEAGQTQAAENAIDKAIALDASMGDAYWQKGVLLQKQGATVDAIRVLATALEKRPSRFEAYSTLALCYEDQNDFVKAEEAWKRAIAGNDRVPEWHHRLGKIYDRKNLRVDAIRELERALSLAEERDGRPGWAADAHLMLGEAYGTTDRDKAILHYSEFLKLVPANHAYRGDAERALARLKKP